jgi:tetratricopeptide (TPR) repeat protein
MNDYFTQGKQLLESGQIKDAIASFQKAIQFDPSSTWSYYHLGLALDKDGQLDGAVSQFKKAIELDPELIWAHQYFGETLVKLGRLEEAVGKFKIAIELKPELSWSYHHLGETLYKLEQWDESIINLRRAIELNPDFSWSHHYLNEALSQVQKRDEVAALSQDVEVVTNDNNLTDHTSTNHYYDLASSLAEQGRLLDAICCYRRGININPQLATSKCFLDKFASKSHIRINVQDLHILPGNKTEHTDTGKIISLSSNQGFVFYGPYIDIPDGWYHVNVVFDFCEVTQAQDAVAEVISKPGFRFDIGSPFPQIIYENIIYSEQKQLQFYTEFFAGNRSEFRFEALGTAFAISHIDLNLVFEVDSNMQSPFYYFDLGSLLQAKGWTYKAKLAYDLAVESSQTESLSSLLQNYQEILPNQPEWEQAYIEVAYRLSQKLERKDDAISLCQQVLQIDTSNVKANSQLAILLAEKGQIDAAVNHFRKLQKQPNLGENCEYIWRWLNSGDIVNEENIDTQLQIDLPTAKDYFDNNSKYTIVDITKPLDPADQNTLDSCKISLANLEIIKEENQALEEIYINSFQDENIIKLSKQALRKDNFKSWPLLNPKHFQQSIVETGYIYIISPFTGKILRSNQSFIHPNSGLSLSIYRFESIEVFYLITGGWSGGKICIFFPKTELIINLSSEWGSWLSLPQLINEFKANAVSSWKHLRIYLLSKSKKKLAIVLGGINNLGHYFWNFVTGIYYLYENKQLDQIDNFLVGTHKYLDIKHIFPEIDQDKFTYLSECQDIFQIALNNNYFVVQVTDSYIKEDLANRIYQASLQKCSTEFLQVVTEAKQNFPLLWINLRGHNKSWISQVDGYANIIKKLSESYPNISILFDGFLSEQATMEKIISLIPPTVKIYNGLNLAIHETIVWAFAIDSYIAVIGSGLTLVTWIASKKGVAHSERDHYGQMTFWSEVRENYIAPALVPVDCIKEIEGSYPSKGWLNYDCEWQVIYDEIAKVISSLAIETKVPKSITFTET